MGNIRIWRKTMDWLELKIREKQAHLSIDYINKHGERAYLPLANSWKVYFKTGPLFLLSRKHPICVVSLASLCCSSYGLEGREYYDFSHLSIAGKCTTLTLQAQIEFPALRVPSHLLSCKRDKACEDCRRNTIGILTVTALGCICW